MFIKVVNRYLCHNTKKVIEIKRNPYLSLTTKQLIDIINNSINNQSQRIQHLNTLILLGQASKKRHLGGQLKKLTQKCLINLNRIQLNINSYQQQELKALQFAELLNILDSKIQVFNFNFKQLDDLTQLYVNTYSHIFSFQKQLQIYETVSKNGQLEFLKNACISKIQDHIQNYTLNLSEFVRYLRMFNSRVSPEKLQNRLIEMKKSPALCKLSQSQRLILYFLMMNKSLDLKIIEQLGLQPSLIIKSNDNPKQTCIRLQIIKYKNLQIPNLQFLDLIQWDYSHLVWLSQFSFRSSSIFKDRLHQAIISLPLPKESLPSSIFFYATNTQIQQQKHRQINLWLCKNITQSKNEQNLCQMLKQIHQKHWQPFYKQFFRHVLKMSLGNFKWQSQNIIYYMGQVQKIQDQNMQYLRRYILNTYASLGTARKQVPTSSYFYKILQITNVQSFYKNL